MPSRDDLFPLIGLPVEARRDQNRTVTKGKLLDVGQKSIFIRSENHPTGSDGTVMIELRDIYEIRYLQETMIRGPFDGGHEPEDDNG